MASNPYYAVDHVMANTWRLIFEHKAQADPSANQPRRITDFEQLSELLAEYRLIGMSLAKRPASQTVN